MSARPDTDSAELTAANQPLHERPIGRRKMLMAAVILAVPVVAPFRLNAAAQTDGHGCVTPTYLYCPVCARCLAVADVLNRKCDCSNINGNHGCNNPECNMPTGLTARVVGESSTLTSPFNANQSALNDGGFNSSPWK